MPRPVLSVTTERWQAGRARRDARLLAEEVPVALTYDGATHAVMMASPVDLEDFAVGFSLTEGVVTAAGEISDLEIVPGRDGINLRMWLASGPSDAFAARRRRYIGPAGCGMCGLESLAEAARSVPRVAAQWRTDAAGLIAAMAALEPAQDINSQTHAVHAAGFWQPGGAFLLREDVGRHNALDKLAGALARAGRTVEAGIVVLSSRLSVELVQKAAMIGAPVLAAISAPTALAVRTAEAAGITLVGIARGAEFEVFTHAARVAAPARQHVA
ncbi:MAG: formate dehydrogenase accessory sulfurtransferase FdhD [Rhodospirillales bacterium]|nr:formate dehydrogenase accessory sulfurtransferase FdhD [Rhodospirillales bacterium]MDE2197878.1 formate dehydrogenase accessory sulfurtransferase FdhD [Rhodospirillales bacterium]MDE2577066.1 formate dehydrogenase accessory sulfurtransferase FdhD [Rhodospirillales bacterium]